MPVDIEPPELARLVDFAERPRIHDWSLRAALVRYAQPQPERVGRILDLVRRIEFALHHHRGVVEREGRDLWSALESGNAPDTEPNRLVFELLRVMALLDGLGDVVAEWAVDTASDRPDADVDRVTAEVAQRVDALGIPREERQRPPPRPARN